MTTNHLRTIIIAVIALIIVAAIGWPSLVFIAGFMAAILLLRR